MDPLTEKQQEFVRVIEVAEVRKHLIPYRRQGIRRRRDDRLAIEKVFVTKAVYNFPIAKAFSAALGQAPSPIIDPTPGEEKRKRWSQRKRCALGVAARPNGPTGI